MHVDSEVFPAQPKNEATHVSVITVFLQNTLSGFQSHCARLCLEGRRQSIMGGS